MAAAGNGIGEEALNSRHACAACKHQRKRCDKDCIFADHFPANRAHYFQEVHKIFGVKNVTNILENLSGEGRRRAVESLEWEALAWKEDAVEGPLGLYRKLEKELESLKAQLNNPQQLVAPSQNEPLMEIFNHNSAGFVPNGDDISAATFNYGNNPNFGSDQTMIDYHEYWQSVNNIQNRGVDVIPTVPYCPRMIMQQERAVDPAVRATVLPKEEILSNQIIGCASTSYNPRHQQGSQERGPAHYDGSVNGPQVRRMH